MVFTSVDADVKYLYFYWSLVALPTTEIQQTMFVEHRSIMSVIQVIAYFLHTDRTFFKFVVVVCSPE
jgi:hypothetical protein